MTKYTKNLDKMIKLLQDFQGENDGHDHMVDLATEPGMAIVEALTEYKTLIETLQECPDCMATLKIVDGKLQFVEHAS